MESFNLFGDGFDPFEHFLRAPYLRVLREALREEGEATREFLLGAIPASVATTAAASCSADHFMPSALVDAWPNWARPEPGRLPPAELPCGLPDWPGVPKSVGGTFMPLPIAPSCLPNR